MKRVLFARIVAGLFASLLLVPYGSAQARKSTTGQPSTKQSASPASKSDLIDINSATKQELMTLAGIGEAYSQKIIDGRPYKMKTQLKTRKIIPDATYDKIADKIIAKQPKK